MTYPPGSEAGATGRQLSDEQAALRRAATLLGAGAAPAELFAAVADDVAHELGAPTVMVGRYETDRTVTVLASRNEPSFSVGSRWPLDGPSVSAAVLDTGRPARIDDYTELPGAVAAGVRDSAIRSIVGVPIMVDGSIWGVMTVGTLESELLPGDTEERLSDFTELAAIAISNAESRDRSRRLADEQAALRRVATLVAEGSTAAELFAAVANEVGQILGALDVMLERYEPDGETTMLASLNEPSMAVGSRWPLDGPSISATVLETGQPARIDDYSRLPGTIAAAVRASGIRAAVGVPITVDGETWGVMSVGVRGSERLPPGTEDRLSGFTELVATAISNAESHERLHQLAEAQSALRRVATLVARAATSTEIFGAVAEEVAHVLALPAIEIVRYGSDGTIGTATVIATSGDEAFPVGSSWSLDGPSVMESVFRTGRPARVAGFAGLSGTVARARTDRLTAIGAPIVVDGATWGSIIAISTLAHPIPEGSEIRLNEFTELVATAVSNLQAHDDLRGLADEQAALRRVATLVADGATAEELFSGVATEVAQVLDVSASLLDRYEPDGTAVMLATSYDPGWTALASVLQVGMRWPPDPGSLTAAVFETGRAARIDDYSGVAGIVGETSRAAGIGSGCSAPIIVDGTLWGAIRVFSREDAPLPADTEARLEGFTELVATAVSNAAARAELIASRARIVAAGDEARRRIERNLHDGTQQRLIAFGLDLQRIRAILGDSNRDAKVGLEHLAADLESVLEEVRELSRGLHPPLLSHGGLLTSLRVLGRRSPIPVEIDVELQGRPPVAIETALYYVAAEAVTNAIRHSQASAISVRIETDHGGSPYGVGLDGRRGVVNLQATIADDGVGGAELAEGSGLMGLVDRIDALGGRLVLDSPPGGGTRISIALPLSGAGVS